MKIMVIGDVVGRPGRSILKNQLEQLKNEYEIDLVIVNGENASSGTGIIEKHAVDLFAMGIDVLTTGNHVWDKKETEGFIDQYPRLLRPANYPDPCPGAGVVLVPFHDVQIAVINLSGRSFMKDLDCPFRTLDRLLDELPEEATVRILDFHAETTSEKLAMGYYASKRMSLVYGTHTHVQTADVRILDQFTGYVTDVGMTGPLDGVIGVDKDIILKGYLTQRPIRYELATGRRQINGLIVQIDETSGRCIHLEGFLRTYEE
jgi:hypothetical protein